MAQDLRALPFEPRCHLETRYEISRRKTLFLGVVAPSWFEHFEQILCLQLVEFVKRIMISKCHLNLTLQQ